MGPLVLESRPGGIVCHLDGAGTSGAVVEVGSHTIFAPPQLAQGISLETTHLDVGWVVLGRNLHEGPHGIVGIVESRTCDGFGLGIVGVTFPVVDVESMGWHLVPLALSRFTYTMGRLTF